MNDQSEAEREMVEVERLARVIAESDVSDAWETEDEAGREEYRVNARAVLAYLAAASPVGVEGEDEGDDPSLRCAICGEPPFSGEGFCATNVHVACLAAASPSSPTGSRMDGKRPRDV